MFKKLRKNIFKTVRSIEKRVRFVISATVLAGLLVTSTFFFFDKFWLFIPILIVASYVMTYFSVLEGIEKYEWLMLFIMPVFLTVVCYLFWFLFPTRWIARIPFVVVYGLSIYAILLTSNIFNVGAEKSLQLHRAAFSVNYFYQTIAMFLLFSVLLSFKQNFLINAIVAFVFSTLLAMQLFWSVKPKTTINLKVVQYALIIGGFITQCSIVLSFAPIRSSILALFLTACFYSFTGLVYHYIDERLFKQTIREYLVVLGVVSAIVLLSIQW
jgi:hypothetical protein